MLEEKQGGASDAIAKGASAARTIQGAVKTGKAIAGIAKGAAAGGPYGAAAMAVWQNRKLVVKIILAAAFIMMLPILFILMLPSLIFGGLRDDSPEIPVMNDNAAIYANIDSANTRVRDILSGEHDAILDEIQENINALDSDAEHEIIDSFDIDFDVNVNTLISQYCAYKDNWEEIAENELISMIERYKNELFSFTEVKETKEVTRPKEVTTTKIITEYEERTVVDASGNTRVEQIPVQKTITVTETVEETVTVMMHTYTVVFAGADYFANEVFYLDAEKAALARDYAENLAVFLKDRNN